MKSKILTTTTENTLKSKIQVICAYFTVTSNSEINTLYSLYNSHNNAHFYLSKEGRVLLCEPLKMTVSAFNQSIHRLIKKDLIRKIDGKNYCLNPVFADIDTVDQINFRFLQK